ncbi:MAG TPA: tol-pal system-associated acyl-CoA thioesterase [Rubrivivax sp.]|nr:tol-pal system-associated acyl-CoA thioesterase [Pseudomonadota bacterium]HOW48163.1 tol-pal system-associated acyl-CoA thioesterase [Rubrivivax sp.]HRY90543.1 tol-pal system-associated acyl-CoA thioesterase [Rubrivivax sp.]
MPAPPPTETRGTAAAPAAFHHPVRVYWEDTDAGGVVYYANYLKFFERARTEWLRALGCGQQQLLDAEGLHFVVSEATLRFVRAARLDDLLAVTAQLRDAGRASLRIAQQAWRGELLLAEAEVRIGCARAAGPGAELRPCRIPETVLSRLR